MFFKKGRESIIGSVTNLRGVSLRRKYVVFESDDWGALRMPGLNARRKLEKLGLDVSSNRYNLLDCLENRNDLENFLSVLEDHRSAAGKAPRFTMNMILGNPNFEAIRAANFEEYIHEDLFESSRRCYGEELQPVWRQGMADGLIRPQFHGREHLNVGLWLDDLRAGHRDTRLAFDHGYFGLATQTSSPRQKSYLAAYWPTSATHFRDIETIVKSGLDLFEELFGYRSRSFIACNYVCPDKLESALFEKGVKLIQAQRGQLCPSSDGSKVSIRRFHTGQRNRIGQFYSVRNVRFEPFQDVSRDWVASAMHEIKSAFFWRTPAIVTTHRVNYVGSMDVKHRDRSLRLLDSLLHNIRETWPDVEFVTSDELLSIIED